MERENTAGVEAILAWRGKIFSPCAALGITGTSGAFVKPTGNGPIFYTGRLRGMLMRGFFDDYLETKSQTPERKSYTGCPS
jgi:hypothetical protein